LRRLLSGGGFFGCGLQLGLLFVLCLLASRICRLLLSIWGGLAINTLRLLVSLLCVMRLLRLRRFILGFTFLSGIGLFLLLLTLLLSGFVICVCGVLAGRSLITALTILNCGIFRCIGVVFLGIRGFPSALGFFSPSCQASRFGRIM
jgi:hypothetical protein